MELSLRKGFFCHRFVMKRVNSCLRLESTPDGRGGEKRVQFGIHYSGMGRCLYQRFLHFKGHVNDYKVLGRI